ncbi:MAG: S9 family peptidase [Planctomycetes bacterium]|nr:S9 family peptidase [Planctomycetota bacterium]
MAAACTRDVREEAPERGADPTAVQAPAFPYPPAPRGDVVDDYNGVRVLDPYRWLEDADSAETRAWIEAENALTESFLAAVPARERIRERLRGLLDFERFGLPRKEGGRYFFSHNTGLQNQDVLLVADALDAEPRVLLDPNGLSEDGTIALSGWAPSRDGKLLAYGTAEAGSDWQVWRVRAVDTGEDLPDRVEWVKFSGASWTLDGKGFFYSRYDAPAEGESLSATNTFQKVYYHRLGTPQDQDPLIYERPDQKEWGFAADVTEDGRYLIVAVWRGTDSKNGLFYKDLDAADGQVVELLPDFDAAYDFVGNDGPVFRFRTDLDAPRGRVVAIDIRSPARDAWQAVVPQLDDILDEVSLVGGRLVCQYMKDARSAVRIHDGSGVLIREVPLPGIGTASGFRGKPDDPETFYSFASFATPPEIRRLDVRTGDQSIFRRPKADVDPDAFETTQVFCASADGTRVPIFVSHRKDLARDGARPTYLYGYGGFDISITPWFSTTHLVWMEMGGVLAVANLRGGGEYGETWHEAGRLKNKQNVFDDFLASARWLVANGYTSAKRLAIGGGSNGGLLVGACMTQRPELFGAALPAVGVHDMLRFNKFTIGWAWTTEYGSPDDPEMFPVIRAYSPLHNIRPGTAYPATFITTADHDDRVVPAHSFKFAAALQAAQAGPAPILIRIETRAGHGAGKPISKVIEEVADRWAFLVRVFEMDLEGFGNGARGADPAPR